MNTKPIGILDSGVGGLTVVKEMMRQLPHEPIVYIGDTARCPYGSRPSEEIKQFTWELTRYLQKFDIKMLIIACNTATAVALPEIRAELSIPVLGVVHPGARAAIKISRGYHIGVIGTEMTIHSKAYEKALKSIRKKTKVTGLACPKFVPIVENGEIESQETKQIVAETLAPFNNEKLDTLILGCTHYPLLQPVIEEYFGNNVKIISSGEETAREASVILDHTNMLNKSNEQPEHIFLTTGSVDRFKQIAENWLGTNDLQVENVQL
ncbi:glutamate racemase [Bacillus kwashiorkori]|uniref:glutamate racemase n=1 Tax=Bacillus kwashiorkori TaxID=1522318 RepID=UPI00092EDCFB|nr:glutamate racemase [Bacillus kwashiorkori]